MQFPLYGKHIILRPATLADRKTIYKWLAHTDLTHQMLGAPNFPDNPVPTWEEFSSDYAAYFFDGSEPWRGRCFIIDLHGTAIGQVNHDQIHEDDHATELDIWLAASAYTGKGYGSDALITLCEYLHTTFHCTHFIIAPSSRNAQAIRAYQKAGFQSTDEIPEWFIGDYTDTVVMLKVVLSKT